jgi:hypothetical protein
MLGLVAAEERATSACPSIKIRKAFRTCATSLSTKVAGLESCWSMHHPFSSCTVAVSLGGGENRNCDRLVHTTRSVVVKSITHKRCDEQEASEGVNVRRYLSATSRFCKAGCSNLRLLSFFPKTSMAPAAPFGHYQPFVSNSERIQHLSRWLLVNPSSAQTLADYPLRC